jgi:ATP-dependent Clp protease, protease subunit
MIKPRTQGSPLQPFPPEPFPGPGPSPGPGPFPGPGPRPVPRRPGQPGPVPGEPGPAGPAQNPAMAPARIWLDPRGWPESLYERLLDRRIVMVHGNLDGDAATRLCAQLLTLDAEGTAPIRLEMQNLTAELPAALSVMGILDVVRGPVTACASGRIEGPALGILAACRHRQAYPNALFVLSEPQVSFDGTVTALASREEQARVMLDELFGRIAEVTGREADQVRADARRNRLLRVPEAIEYGLLEGHASARGLPGLPGLARPARQGDGGGGDGGTGPGDDQPRGDGHRDGEHD